MGVSFNTCMYLNEISFTQMSCLFHFYLGIIVYAVNVGFLYHILIKYYNKSQEFHVANVEIDHEVLSQQMRPINFNHTCKLDPDCGSNCDVCCQLPYHAKTGLLKFHHYDARTGLWNEDKRFENLTLNPGSLILYVGGNE